MMFTNLNLQEWISDPYSVPEDFQLVTNGLLTDNDKLTIHCEVSFGIYFNFKYSASIIIF